MRSKDPVIQRQALLRLSCFYAAPLIATATWLIELTHAACQCLIATVDAFLAVPQTGQHQDGPYLWWQTPSILSYNTLQFYAASHAARWHVEVHIPGLNPKAELGA